MYSQQLTENQKGKTRFFIDYKDPRTGKTKTVSKTMQKNTAATREAARKYLTDKIKALMASPQDMTLKDLADRYAAYQRATFKPSTCVQNEMHMVGILSALGEDTRLATITAGMITSALMAAGKDNTWRNGKLRHLKALIRWGYEQEYISSTDSIDRVKPWPEPPTRIKVKEKYMERTELEAVIKDMTEPHWVLLTRFLAASGLRIGEAMALTFSDIDFTAKTLTVNKTYALITGGIQSTKTTTSDRTVYLRPELARIVSACCTHARRQALVYGYHPHVIFAKRDGSYICYKSYADYFRDHTEKAIGRRLSVHSLRHTYTSLMAEAGVPLETISRELGHADSKVTREVYMHTTEQMRKREKNLLDAVALF